MRKPRWLRPEPDHNKSGLTILMQNMLLFAALSTFYGMWLLVMWVPESRLANQQEINTLLLGMALSLAVLCLRNRWPKLGTWLYVVSSLPLYVLIYQVYGREVTLALYAMPTLIAALLLGFWPGVGTGLASMGFMLLLPLPAGSSTRYFWFLLVALAGGIGLVAEHILHLLMFSFSSRAFVRGMTSGALKM